MNKFRKIIILSTLIFLSKLGFGQQKILDSLLNLLQTTQEDTIRVLAMDELCYFYRNSEPIKALDYGKKSLALARKINYKNGLSRALSDVGTIFSIRGEFDSTLYYYRESLKVREEIGDKKYIANALSNIGYVFDYSANYDSALTYHLKSLKIREELKDELQIAISYSNIGIIYYRLMNYDFATDYYNKALEIRIRLGDSMGMAKLYSNIAENIYEQSVQYRYKLAEAQIKNGTIENRDNVVADDTLTSLYDTTLFYAEKAYPIFKRMDDKRNLAALISNMGNIYGVQKNYKKALEYYKQAEEIQNELGDKSGKMKTFHNIANIHYYMDNPKKAIEFYDRSMEIAFETEDKNWKVTNYKQLASSYNKLKKYDKAYDAYQKYSQLKEEIFKETMSEQVAEMQTKYETEKKEGQIKLMQKEQDMMRQEQEAQRARQRLYVIGGLIFISLLLIIVFVVSRAYRQKKKANSLLKAQKEQILEQNEELKQQKEEIIAQRDEIESQRNLIEEKNKHITDSIKYAMRIQHAILPSDDFIKQRLKDFFVLFLPKDIVSGDFYWVDDAPDGSIYFAAVDCTGHGVPGAFMSIVGSNILNAAVHEEHLTNPADILNYLSKGVHNTLQKDDDKKVKDGMDLCLCKLDFSSMTLQYAGAYNPMVLVRSGEATQYQVDVYPIGQPFTEKFPTYNNVEVKLEKGDTVYVFSDGFQDQFGGPKGKKFMKKRLRETMAEMHNLPMDEQKEYLHKTFEDWKKEGSKGQIDDVIILGVKI